MEKEERWWFYEEFHFIIYLQRAWRLLTTTMLEHSELFLLFFSCRHSISFVFISQLLCIITSDSIVCLFYCLSLPGFFFLFQQQQKHCIVPSADTIVSLMDVSLVGIGENCVCEKEIHSFFHPFALTDAKTVCVCSVGAAVMPERKERKIKTICIWGSHIFSVLAVYHSLWAMCESFVYAGELDCIFFGMMNPKSDVRWRSAEQWGKARKIIKQRRVEMKWNIKFYLNRKYVYTPHKIFDVA